MTSRLQQQVPAMVYRLHAGALYDEERPERTEEDGQCQEAYAHDDERGGTCMSFGET